MSSFGEILVPDFSRYGEDNEDELQTAEWPVVEIIKCAEYEKGGVKQVVFITGKLGEEFHNIYFPSSQVIMKLEIDSSYICSVCIDSNKNLVCVFTREISESETNILISKICSELLGETTKVTVIATKPVATYFQDSSLEYPVIRLLTTDRECKSVPKLPQPNTITGISAAIFSYCYFNNIRCHVLVCYAENLYLDSIVGESLKKALLKVDAAGPLNDNVDKAFEKHYNSVILKSSNLYS